MKGGYSCFDTTHHARARKSMDDQNKISDLPAHPHTESVTFITDCVTCTYKRADTHANTYILTYQQEGVGAGLQEVFQLAPESEAWVLTVLHCQRIRQVYI